MANKLTIVLALFINVSLGLLSTPCFSDQSADSEKSDLRALIQVNHGIALSVNKEIGELKASALTAVQSGALLNPATNPIRELFYLSKNDFKVEHPLITNSTRTGIDFDAVVSRFKSDPLRAAGVWMASAGNYLVVLFEDAKAHGSFIGLVVNPAQAFAGITRDNLIVDAQAHVIAGNQNELSPFLTTQIKNFFSTKRIGGQSVTRSSSTRTMIWQLGGFPFAVVSEAPIGLGLTPLKKLLYTSFFGILIASAFFLYRRKDLLLGSPILEEAEATILLNDSIQQFLLERETEKFEKDGTHARSESSIADFNPNAIPAELSAPEKSN